MEELQRILDKDNSQSFDQVKGRWQDFSQNVQFFGVWKKMLKSPVGMDKTEQAVRILRLLPLLFPSGSAPMKKLRDTSEALVHVLEDNEDPGTYLMMRPLSCPVLIVSSCNCLLAVGDVPVKFPKEQVTEAGGVCMPLSDPGPHITHDWGQVVRLRHLYAIRTGLHLLISGDGQIRGSADQSEHSLLEIRPVEPGSIVFSGVATSHFLCMQGDGTLYSSLSFSSDDCTFQELILPDGHNVYSSASHRVLLSLGRRHAQQFLPRTSSLDQTLSIRPDMSPSPSTTQTEALLDTMDSFGRLSQIIHSPSFHKR